jgi:two-component system cell cycle response regulator
LKGDVMLWTKLSQQISRSRLESIPRSFWYSVAFAGAFFGIVGSWFVLALYNPQLSITPGNGEVAQAAFISLVITWVGVKRSNWRRRVGSALLSLENRLRIWVPLAFSIALLLQVVGSTIFAYYDWKGITSLPTWGVGMLLGRYLALLVGIILLPRDISSRKTSLRFVMDNLVLITAIITFSWYFILGPMLLVSDRETLSGNAAFPVFDLLVIICLILLARSTADSGLRITITALSFALIIFVLTDSILVYQSLRGPANNLLSLGWIAGDFTIALSLQAMRWLPGSQTNQEASTLQASSLTVMPLWRSLLSYTLVPAAIGLVLVLMWTDRSSPLAIGTFACSLILLSLIFVKQFVVIQETHILNRGFQRLQHVVEEKNIALEQANTSLEALATTDPLTELPNHRALVTILDQELARSQQYQRSCSLLFFDLDHFKAINDGYGHAGGDIALREFGSLLRATLPAINTIGRWGGEEFVAILPEQNATEAANTAEGLRSAVANHMFPIAGGMHLTCSIGVASSPAHSSQPEMLLQAADSAMYGAKRLGRNQVRLVDDPAVIALLEVNSAIEGRDEAALIGIIHALALLVEKRDTKTGEHSQRVGALLLPLAQSLGLSEAEAQLFSLAGSLHDIGKIVIPDSILQKQGPLTEQEVACIHQHPQVGAEVVSFIPSLRVLAPIIHAHHEWWNGTGYPDKLAGEAIPFGARLLAIVDAYVAMTTEHPDQDAHKAIAELRRGAGIQFDPAIVEQFLLLSEIAQNDRVAVGMA